MKIRNKKTGEVMGLSMAGDIIWVGNYRYTSLAELNAEWEDYKPAEPLIEDKTTRGAIKAWADANLILGNEKVEVSTPTVDCTILTLTYGMTSIDIMINEEITLKNHGRYTIDELCGEEETPEILEPSLIDLDERIKEKEEQTKKNDITLGEPESPDMVADFETRQVRLCAGDPYYDNFVSFKDFLGFAEELKEALEEEE